MKTFKIILLLLCVSLTSCGIKRVYTNGSYGDYKSHVAKPEYQGSKEKALYVSAGYSDGKHSQLRDEGGFDDKKSIFSGSIHKSVTGEYYNYYYGVGGALGNYKFTKGLDDVISDGENKNFFNINTKAGINYAWTRENFDFRFIGLEVAYHYEFGSYQDKLKEIKEAYADDTSILVVNVPSVFSWNLYSEVVYKINTNNALEFGIFAGAAFLASDSTVNRESRFVGYSLAYRYKKFTLSFLASNARAADPITEIRYGIAYRLD